MTLPDPPPPVVRPAELAVGDRLSAADERLAGEVDRLLRPRFGRPIEARLAAPGDVDEAALKGWYEERAKGWRPLPEVTRAAQASGGDGFGYARDEQAFVLLIAKSGADADMRPVTVQRYGGSTAPEGQ